MIDNIIKRAEVESYEKWAQIMLEIPTLNFNKEWDIRIIPPFSGAVARFFVEKNGIHVCSVYLDWYEKLGCMGEPYYELYPWEDDTRRYRLNETDQLIKDIGILYKDAK